MKRIYIVTFFILFIIICLGASSAFSQVVREEKEEKAWEVTRPQRKFPLGKLSLRASVSSGYDSNVNLAPLKKGDAFEEFVLSADFNQPLWGKLRFSFNYDLDVLNYDEITDASNILNHFRLGLHHKFFIFRIGAGYDLGIAYYTHNDDDFLFHRGFLYLGHDISKKIYQQVQFEYGLKDYTEVKALANTIFTNQLNDRADKRMIATYSLEASVSPKLLVGFIARFSVNDSNAWYQNFYDYKSYQGSPYLEYALTDNLLLLANLSYTRKNYNKRRVTLATCKQRDNLYAVKAGLKYKINQHNSLFLDYAYRDNQSKEVLEEYMENVISAGWQYRF